MEKFEIRGLQVDVARVPESLETLREYIDFAADWGYNSLFLYVEGRLKTLSFPWELPEGGSYTPEQVSRIVEYAGKKGMQVIPGTSVLGHAEHFLSCPDLQNLNELRGGITGHFGCTTADTLCPSQPETLEFIQGYLKDLAEIFPSGYMHAGLDEVWSIGYCELCRKRLQNGEGSGDIFISHVNAVNDIIRSLGRQMMIWDDMFEFYPEALEKLHKDIILCSWDYWRDVNRCNGHFFHQEKRDVLALYEKMGLKYIIAPADYSLSNAESFTAYARKNNPMGALMTTWSRIEGLHDSYPCIAFSGSMWNNPGRDLREVLADSVKTLIGTDKEDVAAAVRLARETARIYCSPDVFYKSFGPTLDVRDRNILCSDTLLKAAAAATSGVSKKMLLGNANALLFDNLLLDMQELTPRVHAWATGSKSEDAVQLLRRLENCTSAAARIKQQKVGLLQKRGEFPVEADSAFWTRIESHLQELADILSGKNKENLGLLKVTFFLPDIIGAHTARILVKFAGDSDWQLAGSGCFKGMYLGRVDAYFSQYFRVDSERVPEACRFEVSGYGGLGFAWADLSNKAGRFVPKAVAGTFGTVTGAENILLEDRRWCYTGTDDIRKTFYNRELATRIHGLDLMLQESKS
jgi:hypothetical protein